jgi:hypothetical protein
MQADQNADDWRALAQQTRTFAEATSDHGSRRVMQDLATGYETLATRIEERMALLNRLGLHC